MLDGWYNMVLMVVWWWCSCQRYQRWICRRIWVFGMGTMIVIYGSGGSVGEFRTHITTEYKYLKYVFRDEYIIPDNLRLSSASAQTDRQTGQLWPKTRNSNRYLLTQSSSILSSSWEYSQAHTHRWYILQTKRHAKFIAKYHIWVMIKFGIRIKDLQL